MTPPRDKPAAAPADTRGPRGGQAPQDEPDLQDDPDPRDGRDGLTYADAGVDIDAGNALVERIRPHVARTKRAGVLGGIGGFGGLFELPPGRYRAPVFVSGADGVGTKLALAIELDRHDTIGIDLVAMCANDILVSGAEPLWFLDYYASGALDVDVAEQVVAGIAEGCVRAGMALLGGETAEMPGLYRPGDYDLAGFAVGVVEKADIVDGGSVTAGDAIVGLASSGPHSNGYSLIRRVLERAPEGVLGRPLEALLAALPGRAADDADANAAARTGPGPDAPVTLGEALLAPTRIYVASVRELLPSGRIKAMAHITGGGLTENLPRVLPDGLAARLDPAALELPGVFDWLARTGGIEEAEMRRTFNCGIGFALVVAAAEASATIDALAALGESARVIGSVVTESDAARADDAPAPAG